MAQTIVIDASLTLSWILEEKEHLLNAKQIIEDQINEKIYSIAPTIWLYETLNGLRSALIRSRINKKLVGKYIKNVLELKPHLFDFEQFVGEAFVLASEFNLSIYDSSYVALAKEQRCTFYTGDLKLFNKVKGRLKFIKFSKDYE